MNGKNSFLLDTNIILGFLNGHSKINAFCQQHLANHLFCVSQISKMELLGYPNITALEEKSVNRFLLFARLLQINDEICDQTIILRRKGKAKLKLPDAIIAATAIYFDLVLVTCDQAFSNIEKLKSISQ